MAVRTETVSYHSCDLCGQDYDEADLTRLYGPQQTGAGRRSTFAIRASSARSPRSSNGCAAS